MDQAHPFLVAGSFALALVLGLLCGSALARRRWAVALLAVLAAAGWGAFGAFEAWAIDPVRDNIRVDLILAPPPLIGLSLAALGCLFAGRGRGK